MATGPNSLTDRLKDRYKNLSGPQRTVALAVAALGIVAAVLGGVLGSRTDWISLPQIGPEDRYAVAQFLDKQGYHYQVASHGGLEVERERLPEIQMQLAGQRLPTGSWPGFELFDKTDFGLTDKLFGVRKQQATQGHVRTCIETMDNVRSAHVTVHLPERQAYVGRDRGARPTAAILITPRAGSEFTGADAATVAALVAGMVGEGMKPSDVTISDSAARQLWPMGDEDGLHSAAKLAFKAEEERQLEQKAMAILDRLGPNKGVVQVSVELDHTYHETQKELRSASNRVTVRETSSSQSSTDGSSGAPVSSGAVAGGGSENGSQETTEDTSAESLPGVERSLVIDNQPRVKRLSAALLLNSADKKIADNKETLGEQVKAALGIDETRGDTFRVDVVEFEPLPELPVDESPFGVPEILQLAGYLAEALTVVFVLVVLARTLKPFTGRAEKEEAAAAALAAAAPGGVDENGQPIVPQDPLESPDPKTRVQYLVQREPDLARRELLSWLAEETARAGS